MTTTRMAGAEELCVETPPLVLQDSELARYAEATNDTVRMVDGRALMPPLYSVCLAFPAIFAVVAQLLGGQENAAVVHTGQSTRSLTVIRSGDVLQSRARLQASSSSATAGALASVSSVLLRGEEVVCESRSRLLLEGASVQSRGAQDVAIRVRRAGKPSTVDARLASDQASRYAAASGDANPLHLDPAAARAAGFPGPIMHGMCLLAFAWRIAVEHLAGGDATRVRHISCRFARPVLPGDAIQVRFWEPDRSGTASMFAFDIGARAGTAVKSGLVEVSAPAATGANP